MKLAALFNCFIYLLTIQPSLSTLFSCRGDASENNCGKGLFGLINKYYVCNNGKEKCVFFPSIEILLGYQCGRCFPLVCTKETSYSISTVANYDTLVLPERFGEQEDKVIWDVSFATGTTKFQFNIVSYNIDDELIQQSAIMKIKDQPPNSSSLVETTFAITGEQIFSPKCTNLPTVRITIPRNVQTICIGTKCRPVLCSLGPEYVSRDTLDDISFAPSNTKLFFNGNDCQIQPPADWDIYVSKTLKVNQTNRTVPTEFWLNQDLDGDGASNIVEYHGIPIASFFSDFYIGAKNITNSTLVTNPFDPDTDNDLFIDGYELLYGLNGTNTTSTADTDGDGLSDFQEQIYKTNPLKVDTDGDGVDDRTEVLNGTNPLDNTISTSESRRKLQDNCDRSLTVPITLTVGDPSGSMSERYTMKVGAIEHQSTEFGRLATATYYFKAGVYSVTVNHRDSKLATPDYDYDARITYSTNNPDFVITVSDPQGLLGFDSSSTFDATIGKVATLTIVQRNTVCAYSTCTACSSDDKCYWDTDTKTCSDIECASLYTKLFKEGPEACACAKCRKWAAQEREKLNTDDWIAKLPQCPCTVVFGFFGINYAPKNWSIDKFCNPWFGCSEHPGAKGCIRILGNSGTGNQCCYDKAGSYIATGRGAGTPDLFGDSVSWDHYKNDGKTYTQCCKECEDADACYEYIGDPNDSDPKNPVTRGVRVDSRGCLNF